MFSARITEVALLGMTIKLGPTLAAAVRDVSAEAGDPQLASDALLDFLTDLLKRLSSKRDLEVEDVERAKDHAIEGITGPITHEVSVEQTDEGIRISVDGPEDAPVHVTTKPQMLPLSVFDPRAVNKIANLPHGELGRRLYAIDGASNEVLAALGFELEPSGRVVIDAFTTRRGDERQVQAAACATALMSYVREVAKRVGPDRHVYFRVDRDLSDDELRSLIWLGLRPATSDETRGMAAGVYWVDVPS